MMKKHISKLKLLHMSKTEALIKNIKRPSLFILVLMISIGPFGDTEYTPSLPHIANSFGVSYDDAQFTMTSYLIGYAISQIFYGPYSDRFGRRPCMLFGAVMFVIGSAICYLSLNIWMLIGGRFVQALGSCAGSVLSNAAVRDAFPKHEQGRVFATINAAFAVAPGIGPIVGSYVDSYFGWHANFLVLLILSSFLLLMVWLTLPETNHYPNQQATELRYMGMNYFALFKDPYFLPNVTIVGLAVGVVYSCLTASPALVELIYQIGLIIKGSHTWDPAFMIKVIAMGVMLGFMIGSLLCKFTNYYLDNYKTMLVGLCIMLVSSAIMATLAFNNYITLATMLTPIIVIFAGIAFVVPMCTANALAPFSHITGSASAMLGFFEMGLAALSTAIISVIGLSPAESMPLVFGSLTIIALIILFAFIFYNPYKSRPLS